MFPGQTIGDSLLAVILILAIMVLPPLSVCQETSLRAVPVSYGRLPGPGHHSGENYL